MNKNNVSVLQTSNEIKRTKVSSTAVVLMSVS